MKNQGYAHANVAPQERGYDELLLDPSSTFRTTQHLDQQTLDIKNVEYYNIHNSC